MNIFTLALDTLNKRFYMKRFLLLFISVMALLSAHATSYYNVNTVGAVDATVLTNWTTSNTGAAGQGQLRLV